MKNTLFIYILVLFAPFYINAQSAGSSIFDTSKVHEIRLNFSQSNFWSTLLSNFESAGEGRKVPYIMGDVIIDGIKVDSVGVRLKGFTSYNSSEIKKPIKIDFNRFVKGKKYDGLKKINLNNGTGDPSMQRDVICYDLLRNMGVKAARTSFSKVYINDRYWGLYQNIEQIDKTFLKNNFANGEGNLFKNKGWDSLQWRGSNPNLYHPPYELKTNEEENNWSGFIHFINVLNNVSDEIFADTIQKIFDIDLFLKTLTVDVATNNWDSYMQHGRNWYIYEDTVSNKFSWIPWDYNFSLDSKPFSGFDSTHCFIFADFSFNSIDTISVQFEDQSWFSTKPIWHWDFGDGNSSNEKNPIHKYNKPGKYNVCMEIFINDTCQSDICKLVDTKFRAEDCPSIINGSCPHPANKTFKLVIDWHPKCCEDWSGDCEAVYKEIYKNKNGGEFSTDGFTIYQKDNERVLINRLLSVPEFNNKYYKYFCELLDNYFLGEYLFPLINHNKRLIDNAISQDSNYLFSYDEFLEDSGFKNDTLGLKAIINNRIDSLLFELDTLFNCEDNISHIGLQDIVINEFIASNDSTSNISDPSGKYEDWIELYNNTANEIDLSNNYFSDDISKLKKWQFPNNTRLSGNGYLIVWADKDESEEGIHSNFKLKKSGEQLVLSNSDGSIIDSLTFGEQTTNIALARRPNGTGDFIFQAPTFGFNNNSVSIFEIDKAINLILKPNPVKDILDIKIYSENAREISVKIFSTTGRLVYKKQFYSSSFSIDTKLLRNGFYSLLITDNNGKSASKKIIVSH